MHSTTFPFIDKGTNQLMPVNGVLVARLTLHSSPHISKRCQCHSTQAIVNSKGCLTLSFGTCQPMRVMQDSNTPRLCTRYQEKFIYFGRVPSSITGYGNQHAPKTYCERYIHARKIIGVTWILTHSMYNVQGSSISSLHEKWSSAVFGSPI